MIESDGRIEPVEIRHAEGFERGGIQRPGEQGADQVGSAQRVEVGIRVGHDPHFALPREAPFDFAGMTQDRHGGAGAARLGKVMIEDPAGFAGASETGAPDIDGDLVFVEGWGRGARPAASRSHGEGGGKINEAMMDPHEIQDGVICLARQPATRVDPG
jgi:hypothetical protein